MHSRIISLAPTILMLCACGESGAPASAPAAEPRVEIVEDLDGLWLVDTSGARSRITATRVASFDYDSLAAKQREGAVILYWAAAPIISPDDNLVAYATNREAVANDTSGQSIWLLDRSAQSERVLLHVPGRSYRPVGWLGDDVVFIGDEPGVWAIDPLGGSRRALARGTLIAAASNGSAIAVAEDVPRAPRLRVITVDRDIEVPPAPDGALYLAHAAFSVDGSELELEATPDSGRTRVRFVFDVATGRLAPAP